MLDHVTLGVSDFEAVFLSVKDAAGLRIFFALDGEGGGGRKFNRQGDGNRLRSSLLQRGAEIERPCFAI